MSARSGQVSVGTAATAILTNGVGTIKNSGATSIFLGGSGVTTANGYELETGESIDVDARVDSVYGIVAAATERADYLAVRPGD